MTSKFAIQDNQYKFPYHHLVQFGGFSSSMTMAWGFEYYAYVQKVVSLVGQLNPKSLLDVGCGEGKMILELSKVIPGEIMHGVDLSERAILFAKAFNYGNGSTFECRDVSTLSDTYDVITLIETIEHIPDEDISKFVASVSGRLNPEGRVIVSVPSVNFPVIPKHYRHYDRGLIQKQFEGFTIESLEYYVRQGFLYKLMTRLSRIAYVTNFTQKLYFVIAQKFCFSANEKNGRHIVCVLKIASL